MFFLLHIRAAGQNLPSFDETQPTGPLKIIIPDEIFIFVITRIKLFFPLFLPSLENFPIFFVFSPQQRKKEKKVKNGKKRKKNHPTLAFSNLFSSFCLQQNCFQVYMAVIKEREVRDSILTEYNQQWVSLLIYLAIVLISGSYVKVSKFYKMSFCIVPTIRKWEIYIFL